jgi:DNA polymerase-3 subunit beta
MEAALLNVQPVSSGDISPLHIVLERDVLLRALGHVQGIVERRNTIPILGNVRIDAEGSHVKFTATDMDIALVETVQADVQIEGHTTAPAHMLYDIVRKLPEGAQISLEMDTETGRMDVKAGRSSFTLACLPVEDFPVMEAGDFENSFSLSSVECIELLDKTRFAISTEETRYYLNGIYLHALKTEEDQLLRAVATDGHRLARMEIALPAGAADMPGIIIPRKTVGELKKVLEESDKEVTVDVSATKIRFVSGNATLVSKLIDGTFPDYERVVPKDNDKMLEVDADTLKKSVDRVSTIAADKSRAIKLTMKPGVLGLMADAQDHGNAHEELEVQYSADEVEAGFNSRYLIEMLSQIEGETVQMVFSDSSAPAVIRDTGNVGALYVIMPMRV